MQEAEDFTSEELALIDKLDTRQPIVYGRRTFEIHYEAGKRVRTSIINQRDIVEKFRKK